MKLNAAVVAIVLSSALGAGAADLKVQTRYPVPGNEKWDYITVDSVGRRIYISHSVRVNVLDEDNGAQVGTLEDTPVVHGIAIDPKAKHGFTSNGKEDKVSMFDTATLVLIKKIDVGKEPTGFTSMPDPGECSRTTIIHTTLLPLMR